MPQAITYSPILLRLLITVYVILSHENTEAFLISSLSSTHQSNYQQSIPYRQSRIISMITQTPPLPLSSSSSSNQYSSFFQIDKLNQVLIESPAMNSRRITAGILIDASPDDIWAILTDYNNLATHVPNLVQSYLVPSSDETTIRLFQEGAQKIIGFDFRASLTMDMREDDNKLVPSSRPKRLHFKLVDSSMFSSFDGEWIVRTHSRRKELDASSGQLVFRYKTLLIYTVLVRPRGPVPVIALEWRIKEDVPINLEAMKIAAEKVAKMNRLDRKIIVNMSSRASSPSLSSRQWLADETLGIYADDDTN